MTPHKPDSYAIQAVANYRTQTDAEISANRRAVFKFRKERGLPDSYRTRREAEQALQRFADAPAPVEIVEKFRVNVGF